MVSNVPISPEQLDAEAAPLDLDDRIAMHRLMFRHDAGLPLRLHQHDGDDAGLGAPFNAMFAAYLDGQLRHSDSWNGSLLWMREKVCRQTHSTHWAPPEWGGSLCYRLTSHVIRLERDIPGTMESLGLADEPLTKRTLESALIAVENHLEWMMRGDLPEVRREPREWMAPASAHKPLGGLHAAECPQCRRLLDLIA
jgi:hypothetical protein